MCVSVPNEQCSCHSLRGLYGGGASSRECRGVSLPGIPVHVYVLVEPGMCPDAAEPHLCFVSEDPGLCLFTDDPCGCLSAKHLVCVSRRGTEVVSRFGIVCCASSWLTSHAGVSVWVPDTRPLSMSSACLSLRWGLARVPVKTRDHPNTYRAPHSSKLPSSR